MQPLEATTIALIDLNKTSSERLWERIPVIGWAIAGHLWGKRTLPIVEEITQLLLARPKPEPQIWGNNPKRVKLGLYLSRVIQEEMSWINDHFIPDDPARVVFWAHEDGLDVEFAVLRIEEELEIQIDLLRKSGTRTYPTQKQPSYGRNSLALRVRSTARRNAPSREIHFAVLLQEV